MEQHRTSGALLAMRLLLGMAVAGLVAVGVVEMQASLLSAVLAVATFGFVVANVVLWQNGERSRRLWERSGVAALKAVTMLLVFVGSISVLDGATSLVGVALLVVWWTLLRHRAEPRLGGIRRRTEREGERKSEQEGARKTDQEGARSGGRVTGDREATGGPGATAEREAAADADRNRRQRPSREPDATASRPTTGTSGELVLWLRPGARIVGDAETLVRALDTASLARAWAACRAKGIPEASIQEQMELARLRQLLLDEFERRDPVAFAAWLKRGAPDEPPLPVDGR